MTVRDQRSPAEGGIRAVWQKAPGNNRMSGKRRSSGYVGRAGPRLTPRQNRAGESLVGLGGTGLACRTPLARMVQRGSLQGAVPGRRGRGRDGRGDPRVADREEGQDPAERAQRRGDEGGGTET